MCSLGTGCSLRMWQECIRHGLLSRFLAHVQVRGSRPMVAPRNVFAGVPLYPLFQFRSLIHRSQAAPTSLVGSRRCEWNCGTVAPCSRRSPEKTMALAWKRGNGIRPSHVSNISINLDLEPRVFVALDQRLGSKQLSGKF